MELLGILHALWRRRFLICIGALAALAAGVLATHRPSAVPPGLEVRGSDAAVARARMLADTPRSLLSAARPNGYATAATRAALLGSLLASDRMRTEIARRAGLSTAGLGVINAYSGAPVTGTPLSREAIDAARPTDPQIVTVSVDDPLVPVVSILAQAPSPGTAVRLADAATAALESLAGGPLAGGEGANPDGVEFQQLGALTVRRIPGDSGYAKAGIAVFVVFALWCSAVVLADALIQRHSTPAASSVVSRAGAASSWSA